MDAKESSFALVHVTRTYSGGEEEEEEEETECEREREKHGTSDGGFKGNEGRKEREDR